MDQVKKTLALLKKHGFWVSCVAILLVATGIWFKASSSLQQEMSTNLSAINAKYQTANTLKSKQKHPNEHSHKAMDALNESALQKVLLAWEKQYDFQKNILLWPRELKDDFIAAVQPLKPIEAHVDFPIKPEQKLKVDFRARYANYVEKLLPRLSQLIGATWLERTNLALSSASADTPARMASGAPILVDWNTQDQMRLLATHFDWSSQADAAPDTLQVLYAQEDLWVLTALMATIKRTNGDIESRHEAAVKSIETILIGRDAIGLSGQVTRLQGGGLSGGEAMPGSGQPGSPPAMPIMPSPVTMPGMATGQPTGASVDPADGRYVDNNFTPLTADKLRTALKSENPSDAFLVVAKRMPVRMRLTVDQRKLHRFLAECGNSPLPIEVRQVRLNRTSTSSMQGGMPGYGGGPLAMYGSTPGMEAMPAMPMDMPTEGGVPGFGSPYGGSSYGGTGASAESLKDRQIVSSTSSYDVPVEIYGIIYIYNPVNRKKLGIDENAPVSGTTAAVQPATVPAG